MVVTHVGSRTSHLFPQLPTWLNAVVHPYQPAGWASIVKLLRLNCPAPQCPLVMPSLGCVPASPPPKGWKVLATQPLLDPESLEDQFAIAMKHEGPNLCILGAAIHHPRHAELVTEAIRAAIESNTKSAWARRLWFLFEWFTEQRLPFSDVPNTVQIIDLLDPAAYYTTLPVLSPRHRVCDNLLGSPNFCPVVRRTPKLQQYAAHDYGGSAQKLLDRYGHVLARDYSYDMVLQETIHSMTIEGVHYGAYDLPKLISTLIRHGNLDDVPLDEEAVRRYILPAMMAAPSLPDESYTYRNEQVYVSETICTVDDTKDLIHFVAAKASDCQDMIAGLFNMLRRIHADLNRQPGCIDGVVAASVLGFGFVFIHPFDDGNGRVHRFLIQQALRRFKYVPQMMFPVSRVMVREPEKYFNCLEEFDLQSMPYVVYTIAADGRMTVLNETDHLYRYFDCTAMAEYLYSCVQTCVEEDLPTYCSLIQSTWDHAYI